MPPAIGERQLGKIGDEWVGLPVVPKGSETRRVKIMRHSLRNVALVGVLSVVGLIGLGNSTAMAQGFGGYPGGYGGGYPSGGYGSGYGSPGGFAPGVGYGAGYSVPQYGNSAYVGNGGYGGYGRGYFGGYAPSSYSHHHRHHHGCGHRF